MVHIRGESVPNELVGLEEPTPYIYALFSHTAKMDKERAKMEVKKAHEVTHPVDSVYHRIKVASLFPNVFTKPQSLRSFPKKKADNMDAAGDVKALGKKERREGDLM